MKNSKTEVATKDDEVKAIANINGVYVHEETPIDWIITANPKRPSGKSHARFEAYMKAKTVGEYLKAGGTTADLKYDQSKGFLALA